MSTGGVATARRLPGERHARQPAGPETLRILECGGLTPLWIVWFIVQFEFQKRGQAAALQK